MPKFNNTLIVLFLLLAAVGCKRFPDLFEGEKVLARAGKETLRKMDLDGLLPAGVVGADSIKWVENYVDRWVRDNLKLQEAAQLFGDNAADEALVEAYRNSLITSRLEQHFIRQSTGGELYTEEDLHNFYNEHRSEFVLNRPIVRGRVVAFPKSFRQKAHLRLLFGSWQGEEPAEVQAMAQKGAFLVREVTDWMDYSEFLTLLPTRRNDDYDEELARTGVQEMIDGDTIYWFVITEKRTAGETEPYERVSEIVHQSVATRRRAEIIKACEDSLYRIALLENKAVIHL